MKQETATFIGLTTQHNYHHQTMVSYIVYVLVLIVSVSVSQALTVGLLMSKDEVYPGFPSTGTSAGAISLALEKIRATYGINVTVKWRDTRCVEGYAMLMGYDLAKKNVSVIIGPACAKSMEFVTKLMSVMIPPVPTITWLPRLQSQSSPHDANMTGISTYGFFESMSDALVIALRQFSWNNVGIIASNDQLCVNLIESMNDKFPNKDINIKRLIYMDNMTDENITNALKEVKDHARVVVVCLPPEFLYKMLLTADSLGMHAEEFAFIYSRFGPSPESGLVSPSLDAEERQRILSPLLQLSYRPVDASAYQKFLSDIENRTVPGVTGCCKQPDEFAVALHDTLLYVADMLWDPTKPFNYQKLRRNITTITGTKQTNEFGQFSHTVALFHYQSHVFEDIAHLTNVYIRVSNIDWPGGRLPPDTPACGWGGGSCSSNDKATTPNNAAVIGSCIALAVILVATAVFFIAYRKMKFEKELLNMIWKVNNSEIKIRRPRATTQTSIPDHPQGPATHKHNGVHPTKKLMRMETRGTLGLGSTTSIDKNLLFAPVGNYKGSIVAVKNIQRRNINLTREVLRDLKALRELQHENLNPFIGVSLDPDNSYILNKYCSKGSLQDILENDDIKLDHMFKMSFTMDIARGLGYLHKSVVRSHGNLKSSNCVIDSRWMVKITDFGALVLPAEEPQNVDAEHEFYTKLLWTAPEFLRLSKRPAKGTQKGDVYSFAIIIQEIFLRCPPYYYNNATSNKVIINRLRYFEEPPYRPRLTEDTPDKLASLATACWQESPDLRPDMYSVLKILIDINGGRKINIMDNMIKMLEAYSNNLEELVANRTDELAQEKQKTDTLLYQMLPPSVAEQLKRGEHVVPETFSECSLFFSDIVGFTSISSGSTPLQVIDLLNDLYTTFDEIIGMHDVYKVETIGDAYMVASGIPRRNGKRHTGEIANMALDLLSAVTSFRIRHMPDAKLQLRIGLHTGHCAAGVVGLTMPRYCLFGDTVNMASRMESTGKAFHIHISSAMHEGLVGLQWGFLFLERGVIDVKGKGLQKTYWLIGKEGFNNTLPEEIQTLRDKYNDAMEKGGRISPTDTQISTGSQLESTSMYGSAFRRASLAITFLRQISHHSSPSGSTASMREMCDNGSPSNAASSDNNNLNIPQFKPIHAPTLLPNIPLQTEDNSDNHSHSHSHKKKRKKKKRSKERDIELKVPSLDLSSIPCIQVTSQTP